MQGSVNTLVICYCFLVASFKELLPFLLSIPGVEYFLSEKLSQDPLEKFFGCQRQKGRSHENPTVAEFCKNTQSLRVIDSINVKIMTGNGNCRGTNKRVHDLEQAQLEMPLKKRRTVRKRRHSQ